MGRARENFNSVYFKDETGAQMSFANGSYANKLRFIFWNLMDSHVLNWKGRHAISRSRRGQNAPIWCRKTAGRMK